MEDKVYSSARTKIDRDKVTEVKCEEKGLFRDTYPVYEWSYLNPETNWRFTYVTLLLDGEHRYVPDTGHGVAVGNPGWTTRWGKALVKTADEVLYDTPHYITIHALLDLNRPAY